MLTAKLFVIVSLALSAVHALKVPPGSPCATVCGNVQDRTNKTDIVCEQSEYATTDAGKMFEDCLSCMSTSTYTDDGQNTDLQWMLYNLRYAVSYCVFGYPDNRKNVGSSPCMTSEGCGHYEDPIKYKNLSLDTTAYEYCDAWPGDETFRIDRCQECLHLEGDEFMANYMIALEAGCDQRPAPGLLIGLDGNIFEDKMVNATAASPSASVDPSWFDDGPLTLPIKVAIGAAGVVVLLFLAGAFIIWNGRRRRRAFLRKIESRNSKMAGWASPQQTQQMKSFPFPQQAGATRPETHDTPLSQRPLVRAGWDDSPMTAGTEEKPFPRYFSPYSSQYNSPVSAHDTPGPQWQQTPAPQNIGVALGGDDSSGRWSPERDHTPESYEMHNVDSTDHYRHHQQQQQIYEQQQQVHQQLQQQYPQHPQPPTLAHPGYGRSSESPPRRYGLGEDDAAGGRAF